MKVRDVMQLLKEKEAEFGHLQSLNIFPSGNAVAIYPLRTFIIPWRHLVNAAQLENFMAQTVTREKSAALAHEISREIFGPQKR